MLVMSLICCNMCSSFSSSWLQQRREQLKHNRRVNVELTPWRHASLFLKGVLGWWKVSMISKLAILCTT